MTNKFESYATLLKRWGIGLGVVAGLFSTAQAQLNFTRVTSGPLDVANSLGAAWVDIDNDGDLDLYVTNEDGANLLYRNEGNGVFTKITENPILDVGPGSFSVSWADIDNDGHIDLFLGRRPGPGLLFRQQPDGSFVRSSLATGSCFGSPWADYDGDGFVDLLVANDSSPYLWHNNRQSGLFGVTGAPIDGSGDAIACADYDNDGRVDVFVAESSFSGGGTSRLYRNGGNGVFTRITSGQLAQRATWVTGAAWGDYDNDGFPDLFLARGDSGQALPSCLFHNDGNGTFTQVEQPPFTTDTGFALGASWGDYDNDGWLDLLVPGSGGSTNRLYHNNGDGTFSRVLSGPIAEDNGDFHASPWGDYDRDGFLDLFQAESYAANRLYHNDGNSNAWITIRCVGMFSNRSAIGTKVRVKANIKGKTFWQLREINTGDGWSENLEAHLGMGDATNLETLRIEWPSGIVQESQNVAAKQYLTVIEPPRLVATSSNGIPQFSLQGRRGMQYDIETSMNLTAWSLLKTATITNLNGTAEVTDANSPSSDRRFYRAVLR